MVTLDDLDRMKKDNPTIAQRFFKRQMQQTKMILSFHMHALKTYGNPGKDKAKDEHGNSASDLYSTLQFSTI